MRISAISLSSGQQSKHDANAGKPGQPGLAWLSSIRDRRSCGFTESNDQDSMKKEKNFSSVSNLLVIAMDHGIEKRVPEPMRSVLLWNLWFEMSLYAHARSTVKRAAASGSRGCVRRWLLGGFSIGKTERRDVTSSWASEPVNGHIIWMILMRRIVRHHAGGRISFRRVWQGELRWREGSKDRFGWNRRVGRLVEAVFGRLQSNVHSLSSVPSIPPSPIRCRYSGTPSEAAKQRLNNGQDGHVIH